MGVYFPPHGRWTWPCNLLWPCVYRWKWWLVSSKPKPYVLSWGGTCPLAFLSSLWESMPQGAGFRRTRSVNLSWTQRLELSPAWTSQPAAAQVKPSHSSWPSDLWLWEYMLIVLCCWEFRCFVTSNSWVIPLVSSVIHFPLPPLWVWVLDTHIVYTISHHIQKKKKKNKNGKTRGKVTAQKCSAQSLLCELISDICSSLSRDVNLIWEDVLIMPELGTWSYHHTTLL